jgi:hypothetical protein
MTTLTFDTLRYTERLRAAGISEPQAKAEAEALRDVLSEALDSTLATKLDVTSVRTDIGRLEREMSDMRKDMLALELRLTIKLGAFLSIAAGIIISVLRVSH